MPLHKYVVAVERDSKTLSGLAGELKRHGFPLLRAVQPEAAAALVQKSPELAVVLLDDEIGRVTGSALVTALKRMSPDLPIVWVARGPLSLSGFAHYFPDVALELPLNIEELAFQTHKLLNVDHYTDAIVTAVSESAQAVLMEAFGSVMGVEDTYLRANPLPIFEVSALLPFVGRGVGGRLIVSANDAQLAEIRHQVFGGDKPYSPVQLEDLIGEICNLVFGRIAEFFARRAVPVQCGSPAIIRAEKFVSHYRAGTPSFVSLLSDSVGGMAFEFFLDRVEPSAIIDEVTIDIAQAGNLLFF